ncbi:Ferric iron ABC transporter, iron-binding protein [Rhodovastum atsumiense]|uniref:Putative 2-aminoethylphosphonate ABC transporter substrate-binding protein n=1 Tax=Rhodovastum atsumiense TaxID=504468 RepID=A0A5M6IZ05_9PROT|nr:putative 2-aminoethylphosphonate ABC transporter substrate-binding protein [Rhodovastum atsumiense]KAA5612615.1 putative 2-aminoethylphosphonate ABC transporter substrate-binding protein [Rhodovastum atsumiense]CAH2601284.1 Ferric iron ABC transporter, iron-binding protein [Rhodovastum atsumiense]
MRRILFAAVAGLAIAAGLAPMNADAAEKLTVYTAFENEQLAPYKKAFEAAHPGIEIQWVRDSTGIITARLLAEKANPQADIVWGLAASSLLVLDKDGLLEAYAPKTLGEIKSTFRSQKSPPTWVGADAWMGAVCFNTVEAAKKKLPTPQSWEDLLNPAYKGQLVMPNPASSGTGFLTVSGWLQMMGEAKAWAYMDKLNENIAAYTHSGSKPCKQAASGEYALGISIEYTGASLKSKGAPISVILPKPASGWDMEATAIVKGTKHLAAAKQLADFAASRPANQLYNDYYAVVAYKGVSKEIPNYPANAEAMMMPKNNFEWAATNRDRILAEWTRRYDSKSEPK